VPAPEADSSTKRTITKFNELMIVAYREFQFITADLIKELRVSHQLKVAHGLDLYAKRGVIRNLDHTSKFSKDQLLIICDLFFGVLFYEKKSAKKSDMMDFISFRTMLGKIVPWANVEKDIEDQASRVGSENLKPIVGVHFLEKLFEQVFNGKDVISLQNVVLGLGKLIFSDLTYMIDLLFELHDVGKKGHWTKEEVIGFSETLLLLFRNEENDQYLGAVSGILQKAFMIDTEGANYTLSKAAYKEIILGSSLLTEYFGGYFQKTFALKQAGDQVERTRVMPANDLAENLLSGIKWSSRTKKLPTAKSNASSVNGSPSLTSVKDASKVDQTGSLEHNGNAANALGVSELTSVSETHQDDHDALLQEVDDLLKEAAQTTSM
jgi:hypothetical protein